MSVVNMRSLLRCSLRVAGSLCASSAGSPCPVHLEHWILQTHVPTVLLAGVCSQAARSMRQGSPKPFLLQPSSWAPKASAACACGLGFLLLGWVLGCVPGHLCCLQNVLLVKALVKYINNCGGRLTKIKTSLQT